MRTFFRYIFFFFILLLLKEVFFVVSADALLKTQHFTGTVYLGQEYKRLIDENLYFCLTPVDSGWTIAVYDLDDRGSDYSLVTSLTRRPLEKQLNTIYPTLYGTEAQEAFTHDREFSFVLNKKDYQKAFQATQTVFWPNGVSENNLQKARQEFITVKKAKGVLRIVETKMSRSVNQDLDLVEYVQFEVELFPSD